ncbi:hypothetical protein [Lysinibacter sp. HNR]|uniref:hypothetical protein n=1 Tax=Lysinibacter sp. HNR TaxID=3031408 RepID=UPI00243492E8|nr:hypothetical protein [Lysinibacter sp. HNR]WGD36962.1 hypothetical protein FrondiHNR_10985 [Lysinibacter sp. HNR]
MTLIQKIIGATTAIGLVLGGSQVAVALEPEGTLPEESEISIESTDDGFVFADSTGAELGLTREFASEGEVISLQEDSEGEPVITTELFGLPLEGTSPEYYQETVTAAQTESEPEFIPSDSPAESFKLTPAETAFDENLLEPVLAYAAKPNSVEFLLAGGEASAEQQNIKLEVVRDGKLLANTDGPVFTDQNVQSNTTYQYEIFKTEKTDSPTPSSDEAVPGSLLTLTVTTPPAKMTDAVKSRAARASVQYSTAYMHTTFIEERYAPVGSPEKLGCGAWPHEDLKFGGDNRYFKTPTYLAPNQAEDYRTMMFVNINWENPYPYNVIWTRNVGVTKKYINGGLLESRKASMDGMNVRVIGANTSTASVVVEHSSGNPFCGLGAITYRDEVRFWRSAQTVQVTGWRFPVPSHELSVRFDNQYLDTGSFWLPMNWRVNHGFGCLLGGCDRDLYTSQTINPLG